MGQFKPMVKMETTEPSVILKLKKGGHVSSKANAKEENGHKPMGKADGGMMGALAGAPALVGRPASAAPVAMPGKPSMAARRKAMMAKRRPATAPVPVSGLKPAAPAMGGAPMGMPAMKKGGNSDAAQDKAMIKKAMKQHDAQEHKGGKGTSLKLKKGGDCYATGGVVMGQGGFKTGGVVKGNGGGYAKGGGVEGNVSGTPAGVTNTKTGGVRLGNAGGFKKGGGAKKFADGGAVQDDGRAVKMPQGNKRPSTPVSINQLSGTFKKGGKVKMAAGGDAQTAKNEQDYKQYEADEEKFNKGLREDMSNALMYIPRKIKQGIDALKGQGSVTNTERERSVTVAKPKKSGGRMC